MANKDDLRAQLRSELGSEITDTTLDDALRDAGNDPEKVREFFQMTLHDKQTTASFEQCVLYLRQAFPVYGAPDSFYEDCVREANNDLNAAADILIQKRNNVRFEKHSPSKPLPQHPKGPTASPIVSVPVYKPQTQQNPAPAVAPVAAANPAPSSPAPSEAPAKSVPSDHPAKPLPIAPVPAPAEVEKPVSSSLDDDRMAKQEEFLRLVEEQKKKAVDRSRESEEHMKKLKELEDKEKTLGSRLENEEMSAEEREKVSDDLHRVAIEKSCLETELNVAEPPDYLKGRLPTNNCVIEVSVADMTISFTWKIADSVEVHPKDWIGLYIHDRQYSNKYETYLTLNGQREGSGCFTAPTIGYFDLRYYQKNGSEEKSRSMPFLVGPKMAVHAKLQGRRKIEVTWDSGAQKEGDWVALYPVSTYSNTKYLQEHPVSAANSDGVLTFDAPRKPGEYEVRYFFTSKKHATGYAFSGRSEHIVVPDEDLLEVVQTHPIVKVHWQTFSQEPNDSDWVGLYDSSDDRANRLGWQYLSKKGCMDTVHDHGIAEIEVKDLMCLLPEGELPENADKYEVRLFTRSLGNSHPFLRAPFLKPH